MRGRVVYLLLSILLCAAVALIPSRAAAFRPTAPAGGKPLKIIIASDLHYLSPRLTDYGERFLGIIRAGDGKVTQYSPQVAAAFVAQAVREKPDAVILSGDLTLNGSKESHEELSALLYNLTDAGIPVFVIPGNHDVDGMSYRFAEKGTEQFLGADSETFERLYAPFGFNRAISRDKTTLSYSARLTEDLWLLCIDVNGYCGIGALPETTLNWAQTQLALAEADGARVIGVSHQNVLLHNERFSFGFQIIKAEPLIELYKRYGVPLNISGHIHVQHIMEDEGLTDIAQSCLMVSPNQYGVLEIAADGAMAYRTEATDVTRWARETGSGNPDLLDFAAYSAAFFRETTILKRIGRYEGQSPETAAAMAAFSAEMNARYFAGTLSETTEADFDEMLSQLPQGFVADYFRSLSQEARRDMSRWEHAAPN